MANNKGASNEASKSTSTSDETAQSRTPPKRAQRQRNPVILLQHDYYQIYDDKNNRSRKRKNGTGGNSDPLPMPTKSSSSASTNGTKRRRTTKSTPEKHPSDSSSPSSASKSIFRWVGPSIDPPPPKSDMPNNHDTSNTSKKKYYQSVEINVGNHPALVGVGEYVLISSADYVEKDLHDKTQTIVRSPANVKSRNAVVSDMMVNSDDEDDVLTSTLKSEMKMEVAMNSLDPYIARVEEMWEEPKDDKKETDPYSRMKILVRWLFKKYDVQALKGEFVGISREQLLSSMTPRDILLGEQTDINEVGTILGKCRVLRLKPLSEDECTSLSGSGEKEGADNNNSPSQVTLNSKRHPPKGAFFCRYNMTLTPAKSKKKGKITIIPYDGPDDVDEVDEPSKRDRAESTASHNIDDALAEGGSAGSETNSVGATEPIDIRSKEPDDDDSSLTTNERRNRKQSITEGNATLKIKVGNEHQAVIPSQVNKRKYSPSRESPLMVWKPHSITDAKLNSYFHDAGKILKDHMMKTKMDMTRSLPYNIPPSISATVGSSDRSSSHCAYREFDVDDLILLLHDHNYNTSTALRGLKNYPQDYLILWSKEDKELYNAGFQKHASNLHSISQNFGNNTKNHKDVVDYHYRFKIPDQFKRFQDLKREQARRMLEVGERLRLNEYLSEGGNNNNGTMNGMKKSQQWSRTGGGGPNEIGEVEARRLECKNFLFEVRDAVGENQYLILVNLLKSLNSKAITIPQMKEGFSSVLKDHSRLLTQFETYLPEVFRSRKV